MITDRRIARVGGLIAASHIIIRCNQNPVRIVMLSSVTGPEQFIVQDEYLKSNVPDSGESCRFTHIAFSNATYFRTGVNKTIEMAEKEAYEEFEFRSKRL